jgi:hypothetical protein
MAEIEGGTSFPVPFYCFRLRDYHESWLHFLGSSSRSRYIKYIWSSLDPRYSNQRMNQLVKHRLNSISKVLTDLIFVCVQYVLVFNKFYALLYSLFTLWLCTSSFRFHSSVKSAFNQSRYGQYTTMPCVSFITHIFFRQSFLEKIRIYIAFSRW